LVARSIPCFVASSKLCGEVEEISVTRATDMALPPDLSFYRAQTGRSQEKLARAALPTTPSWPPSRIDKREQLNRQSGA
jgi:hypothetical protein